jgi:hypothetical protein
VKILVALRTAARSKLTIISVLHAFEIAQFGIIEHATSLSSGSRAREV